MSAKEKKGEEVIFPDPSPDLFIPDYLISRLFQETQEVEHWAFQSQVPKKKKKERKQDNKVVKPAGRRATLLIHICASGSAINRVINQTLPSYTYWDQTAHMRECGALVSGNFNRAIWSQVSQELPEILLSHSRQAINHNQDIVIIKSSGTNSYINQWVASQTEAVACTHLTLLTTEPRGETEIVSSPIYTMPTNGYNRQEILNQYWPRRIEWSHRNIITVLTILENAVINRTEENSIYLGMGLFALPRLQDALPSGAQGITLRLGTETIWHIFRELFTVPPLNWENSMLWRAM